jgi:predicted dehydrogenase
MKNVLFIGLGSIGQRHFRNLKIINKKINFYCIRLKRISPQLNNSNKILKKKLNSKDLGIKEIKFNDIKRFKIDTAFITNPTNLHVKSALALLKYNLNLYIEKPLSNNLNKITLLKNIVKKKKIKCEIGFQTRYDDLLEKLKKIIYSNQFGKIVYCNINHNHFLPNHHKYEDYRISYASNKSMGGGVLLCFSHEIDYAQYLFGMPKKIVPINLMTGKNLKVDVETSVKFAIIYKTKIPVIFNLDFLRKKPTRYCAIQFEKAYIKWDLIKNRLRIENKNIHQIYSETPKRNDLFIKSLKIASKEFSLGRNSKNTLSNAILNLKTILRIKKSLTTNKIIAL